MHGNGRHHEALRASARRPGWRRDLYFAAQLVEAFKDDASEVRTGFECGLGIANFNDVKIGDIIECFQVVKLSAAEAAAQGSASAGRK